MGLDMVKATEEAAKSISMQNYNNPLQQEYIQALGKLGEGSKSKDIEAYIEAQLSVNKLEFELFPKRFGPKGKQTNYVNKYMEFYRKLYEEIVDEKYFDRFSGNNEGTELVGKLKYTVEGGKVLYEWDENFIKYMEFNIAMIENKDDPANTAKALQYHPENVVHQNPQVLTSIALNSMIQPFGADIQEKIVKHFGFDNEYIEIPKVDSSEVDCLGCASKLAVPEGSDRVVCEACGNINAVKSGQITCLNCAADFDPNEGACPYCNSKFQGAGSMGNAVSKAYEEHPEMAPIDSTTFVDEPEEEPEDDEEGSEDETESSETEKEPNKKKGWRRLFGK
jgi:LSD1 subclass zinc finger protein